MRQTMLDDYFNIENCLWSDHVIHAKYKCMNRDQTITYDEDADILI